MILVDTSVWIDYFRGTATPQTDRLDLLLATEPVVVGDLILTEILQGFAREHDFNRARRLLANFDVVELAGSRVAIQAARNFCVLRARGVTVRKAIDTIIATWCMENACPLLHADRDFEPFAQHLGLRSAMT